MPPLLNWKPVKRLTRPLRARLKSFVEREVRVQSVRVQTDLARQLTDAAAKVDESTACTLEVRSEIEDIRTALGDVSGRVGEVEANQAAADDRVRELVSLVDGYRFSLEMLLGPTGRYRSRFISDDEVLDLMGDLDFVGDHERVRVSLHQAYRTLFELELRCIGRFAGSTPNILAKLAAVALMPPPSGEVLEIGTLFGVGAVGIHRQLGRVGIQSQLTILDPFAGYQLQPDRDDSPDIAQTPATRSVVATNLALGGIPPDQYRLIQGTSDTPDSRHAVEDRRYGLVVIDGYHSEELAYSDLLWAESLAAADAVVILDDYDDPNWPGVAAALKRFLERPESRLRLIGTAATTAFLQAT